MRDNASSQPAAPTTIWTPANIVTLIRILLVPVFFVACVSPWPTWFPDWNEAELLKPIMRTSDPAFVGRAHHPHARIHRIRSAHARCF